MVSTFSSVLTGTEEPEEEEEGPEMGISNEMCLWPEGPAMGCVGSRSSKRSVKHDEGSLHVGVTLETDPCLELLLERRDLR